MKKIGERLLEIRVEIPPKMAKDPPAIPEIDENLEFPEKNLEVWFIFKRFSRFTETLFTPKSYIFLDQTRKDDSAIESSNVVQESVNVDRTQKVGACSIAVSSTKNATT